MRSQKLVGAVFEDVVSKLVGSVFVDVSKIGRAVFSRWSCNFGTTGFQGDSKFLTFGTTDFQGGH